MLAAEATQQPIVYIEIGHGARDALKAYQDHARPGAARTRLKELVKVGECGWAGRMVRVGVTPAMSNAGTDVKKHPDAAQRGCSMRTAMHSSH